MNKRQGNFVRIIGGLLILFLALVHLIFIPLDIQPNLFQAERMCNLEIGNYEIGALAQLVPSIGEDCRKIHFYKNVVIYSRYSGILGIILILLGIFISLGTKKH